MFTDVAIIGGFSPPTGLRFDDAEVISVLNNSVHTKNLKIKEAVPSLPKGFYCLAGTQSLSQLPNGDFLLCCENTKSAKIDVCILFKNGSKQKYFVDFAC